MKKYFKVGKYRIIYLGKFLLHKSDIALSKKTIITLIYNTLTLSYIEKVLNLDVLTLYVLEIEKRRIP